MKAIILAGGKGTRMQPLTYTRPKALLPLAGKPVVQHLVDAIVALRGEGVTVDEVIIVTNYLEEKIKEFFATQDFGVKITFAHQAQPLGTGDAVKAAGRMSEPFIVVNGDETYDPRTFADAVHAFERTGALGVVGTAEVEHPELYAVIDADADGRLLRLLEKPKVPMKGAANAGVYVFAPEIFDHLAQLKPSPRGEYELTDAIVAMSAATRRVFCFATTGWRTVSVLWDMLDVNAAKLAELAKSRGTNVIIGKDVEMKPGVVIEGNVFIGDGSVIGPNCYIRGDTSIGRNCRVGNGVEIKNSIIMDGSNVPHLSYVGDSVIGSHCNLGAGTLCANLRHDGRGVKVMVKGEVVDSGRRKLGFFMADWTKTGVNTSIYPGMVLGPFAWTAPSAVVDRNLEPFTMLERDGSKTRIDKEKLEGAVKDEPGRRMLESAYGAL